MEQPKNPANSILEVPVRLLPASECPSHAMEVLRESLEPMGDLELEELIDIYKEQAKILYEAGVDLFVVETMMSLAETRAAVLAIKETCDLPIMVSMTFDEKGKTLYGNTPEGCMVVLQSLGADVVGINCSTGPERMAAPSVLQYAAVLFSKNSYRFSHHIRTTLPQYSPQYAVSEYPGHSVLLPVE